MIVPASPACGPAGRVAAGRLPKDRDMGFRRGTDVLGAVLGEKYEAVVLV